MISNYLKTALINGTLRNTPYTPPAKVYLALYITDPTAADTGTESALGAYVRQEVVFDATGKNIADITFPMVTSGTETITYFGIRDALIAGNLMYYGAFTDPKELKTDNQLIVKAGELSVPFA